MLVQVLALRLPNLEVLDLNRCGQMRQLELRCPLLLTLYMQASRLLGGGGGGGGL